MGKEVKPIIEKVHAREILDSRGFPTVEVEITASGHKSISAVPSGASTGEFEALELRDGDAKRFHGKGVLKAVNNVINNFGPALIGKDASNQKEVDDLLINIDGTSNKSAFGANASLGISMACSVVSAAFYNKPLYSYLNPNSNIMPVPMINVLNGGMHADQGSDLQEIMLFPHGAKNFKHSLQMGSEVFHCLKKELKKQGLGTTVGDEGGFAPALLSNDHAIELLINSVEKAGFNVGKDISLALDVAASSFYKDYKYHLAVDGSVLDSDGMISFYEDLIKKYPIESMMDTLKVNVIPEKSLDKNIQLLFTFTDSSKVFSIFLRKGVLEVQPFFISGSSVQITSKEEDLKAILSGIKSLPISLVNGTLDIEGSRTDLLSFFASLRN